MSGADQTPFAGLGPDVILAAAEAQGLVPDGRFIALNSYENRVYQIGVEGGRPVVAKFYRPGRWSDASILEEHEFTLELVAQEIPVAAPLRTGEGSTLLHHDGFRVAFFERLRGDWPDLDRPGRLAWLGRFLGRIHAVGRARRFEHRPELSVAELGRAASRFLLDEGFLPPELESSYADACHSLLDAVEALLERVQPFAIRLHGDCHPGNVLWSEEGPAFVDMDDCRSGPAVQDLWMLISGEPWEQRAQLDSLLEGYQLFADFDHGELSLVEGLRGLRMVYYSGWLARRWNDPAFPQAFPWFGSYQYWRDHADDLRRQAELLDGPAESSW